MVLNALTSNRREALGCYTLLPRTLSLMITSQPHPPSPGIQCIPPVPIVDHQGLLFSVQHIQLHFSSTAP